MLFKTQFIHKKSTKKAFYAIYAQSDAMFVYLQKRTYMYRLIIFLACIFIGFSSCKKKNVEPSGEEYYFKYLPLNIGNERIYKVTFINIDVPAEINDTTVFFIKETVTNTIFESADYKTFVVKRFLKDIDSTAWQAFDQIAIQKHKRSLVTITNNEAFVSLQFPEKKDKVWDGNLYNSKKEELYTYSKVNTQETVQSNSYDSVLVITQNYFKSLYTYTHKEEKYAYKVGLISKTIYDIESQTTDNPSINIADPIEERITKGTLVTGELISYKISE